MKNISIQLIAICFVLFAIPYSTFAQGDSINELPYEVNRIYPSISFTKKELNAVQTISDLNQYYKQSWVKEYVSVEVIVRHNGIEKRASNKSHTLSHQQKDLINMADINSTISVNTRYVPDNTLSHNDTKAFDFDLTIDPETDATYIGGQQQLRAYLKENVIDKIPAKHFENYNLSFVKFSIDENGEVADAHIHDTSLYNNTEKNEKIEALLLETICNMPAWQPATYSDGTTIKQEFVLTVGDQQKSCLAYLFNTRKKID